jgi:hypothetical protein
MMGQPYQRGKPVVTPGWGWPCLMPGDNEAMPVMTLVRVSSGGPLDAGEGCSGPSNKRQPEGPGHSTRACK